MPISTGCRGACRHRAPADRPARASARAAFRSGARARTCAPSASVPENAMAIHRMPADTFATARPSSTKAKANTSTHDTAKNTVVETSSQLRTSTARSLRTTSQATREEGGHDAFIAGDVAPAQVVAALFGADQPPVAQVERPRQQALGDFEVVRRDDHQAAVALQALSRATSDAADDLIEPRERLVEQQEPRRVDERALERQPLAHAAREAQHLIVGPIGEIRVLERGRHSRIHVADAGGQRRTVTPPMRAGAEVVGPAWNNADHDAHRPRRIGLRPRDVRHGRQRGSACGQMQKLSGGEVSSIPPASSRGSTSASARVSWRALFPGHRFSLAWQ